MGVDPNLKVFAGIEHEDGHDWFNIILGSFSDFVRSTSAKETFGFVDRCDLDDFQSVLARNFSEGSVGGKAVSGTSEFVVA